jgi:hypothetical protein
MIKTWLIVLPLGLALGLGVGWAEKAFHWRKGLGGEILFGIMILAGVCGFYAFYRMLRAEIEDDPWSDPGEKK